MRKDTKLRIALASACHACGVTAEEAGRRSEHGNLRRSGACVTARMIYAVLAEQIAPETTWQERTDLLAAGLSIGSAYQWALKGYSKLDEKGLVEVNPPPLTATEEKCLQAIKEVLRNAKAEYDRRVGSLAATASTAMNDRRTA